MPAALLDARLAAIADRFSGRMGWHAVRLEDGRTSASLADERFGTASVIKVALVACLELGARWQRCAAGATRADEVALAATEPPPPP